MAGGRDIDTGYVLLRVELILGTGILYLHTFSFNFYVYLGIGTGIRDVLACDGFIVVVLI